MTTAARTRAVRRRGTIVPFLALTITGLFAFCALAVDLGMLTVARTECQNAADSAALVGCRTLDNKPTSVNNNAQAAVTAAANVVTNNNNLTTAYTASQITSIKTGTYTYTTAGRFAVTNYSANVANGTTSPAAPSTPPAANPALSWTAMEVLVDAAQPMFFARVFGVSSFATGARGLAVHRPRDVAIVLDFSGSMQFGSTFNWPAEAPTDTVQGILNPDPLYPQFGHYQRYQSYRTTNPLTADATAANAPSARPHPLYMQQAYIQSSGEVTAPANYSTETLGGPPIVKDYQTSTLANGAAVPSLSDLKPAFHHWDPAQVSSVSSVRSGTNPPVVTAGTYNYSSYGSYYNAASVTLPAPDNFTVQDDSTGPTYLGDKWPRKWAAATGNGSATTAPYQFWSPTDAAGPAVNAAEYLGWSAKYASGATLPALVTNRGTGSFPTALGLSTVYSTSTNYNSTTPGSDFRDATWERYGYDLDETSYVNNRNNYGVKWDPRWDYDVTKSAGSRWVHLKPTTGNGSLYPTLLLSDAVVTGNIIKTTPGSFKGYSMGPGYWGKTFFIWPPDPRWGGGTGTPDPTLVSDTNPVKDTSGNWICDWRRRFFFKCISGTASAFDPQTDNLGATGTDGIDEALLRNGTGHTLADSTTTAASNTWRVNYAAVLKWIKSGPQVLPANLRAGHVLYYTAIPDSITSPSTNDDERFWREYIDYVLGYRSNGKDYNPDYVLAGTEARGWPEGVTPKVYTGDMTQYNSGASAGSDPRPYLNYTDNPSRPRLHLWFGPMSMMEFINAKYTGSSSAGRQWNAGTIHEAQCWQLKAGMQSALDDIRNNHPNDFCGLTYFAASFNDRRVPMSQNWTRLKNTLFFPYSLIDATTGAVTGEYKPYNGSFNTASRTNIPDADGGTDPGTGMENAFNLLSSSTQLSPVGTGRRGASKIVIFETDGVPNTAANGSFTGSGVDTRYTNISAGAGIGNGDAGVESAMLAVVDKIVAPVSTTAVSGYSLSYSPARVHAIAFGDLFDTPTAAARQPALDFLSTVMIRGKTLGSGAVPTENVITGDYQTRINNLKSCMERIMQSGVQVTLIE